MKTSRREMVHRLYDAAQRAVVAEIVKVQHEQGYVSHSEHVSAVLWFLRRTLIGPSGRHATVSQPQIRLALQGMIFDTDDVGPLVHDAEITPVPPVAAPAGPFDGYLPCGCVNVQDEQKRCEAHRIEGPKRFDIWPPVTAIGQNGEGAGLYAKGYCPQCKDWGGVVTTGSELDRCAHCHGVYRS